LSHGVTHRELSWQNCSEGGFAIDFGVVKLSGKLSEQDRQCAGNSTRKIVTRVAVILANDAMKTSADFSGEILVESLASLHAFFQEARAIMKSFPVGKLKEKQQAHLGTLIHDLLADVLRPFLEKWQADLRSWWDSQNKATNWFDLQKKYPRYRELLEDWTHLRRLMRTLEHKLRDEYKLHCVDND
jgi:hypothetical protein